MNWILSLLQRNSAIKIVVSISLLLILAILYRFFNNEIFIQLMIIPGLYLIPLIIVLILYAWIVNPIKYLIDKYKKR
jgi:hypothetical protein